MIYRTRQARHRSPYLDFQEIFTPVNTLYHGYIKEDVSAGSLGKKNSSYLTITMFSWSLGLLACRGFWKLGVQYITYRPLIMYMGLLVHWLALSSAYLAAGACKAIESFLSVRRIEDLTYRNTARPQSAQRFVCPRAAPPLDQIRIRQSSRARLCCASNSASAFPQDRL